MKIIQISVLSVFVFAVFTSCDCLRHVQGVVIDAETRLPIDKTMVKEKDSDWVIHTDSIGSFEFTSMAGGLFGCPKISLSFEKEGYITQNKKYKSCCTNNAIVVLKKQAR